MADTLKLGGKSKAEYRHYEMPPGGQALFLVREEVFHELPDVLHFHNVLEIGYCYHGEGTMTFQEEKFPFEEGTFTIIPANIPHMTTSGEDARALGYWKYLFIDADGLLERLYRDKPLMAKRLADKINRRFWIFKGREEREIAEVILRMIKVMEEQEPLYQEELKGLTLTLLIRIASRAGGGEEKGREEQPKLSRNSVIISRAVDYISKAPERPIKIEELARMCHVSETHFRRVFGECMKMTPVEYINQVRIRQACDALERTNDPVNAIAARTGFGTLSTFNRNFRQITGVTPQQWRKNVREDSQKPKE